MKSKAFTLVELLVTISIIGLLAGLSIPAIKAARETAEVGGCMSNIRQLTTALLTAGADSQGAIPCRNWAHSNNIVTNGALWSGGYINNAKVFLCPHGRKSGPPWFGGSLCHYSINVAPENPVDSGIIWLNRIQNPSKAIMLFEEAVIRAAQLTDSCASMDFKVSANTGDSILFTERSGMVNHRKKGCVSFYDGSALSLTTSEWVDMLGDETKRRMYYAAP